MPGTSDNGTSITAAAYGMKALENGPFWGKTAGETALQNDAGRLLPSWALSRL
jgi:hypothetical protein